MTTHNHTAIATGAAANASTINTPLGTLDAAIGNLTTLTTTAKTSAVAAINELDADVGNLATLTTTAKTSAVAAINEVVGAVAAVQSYNPINLVWDALNQYYAPGQSPDSRTRWYLAGTLSQINPDSANPFGFPTIRVVGATGNGGGKRLWLDEMGLVPGDTYQIGILAKTTSGQKFYVAATERTAAGASTKSWNIGAQHTGSGAIELYTANHPTNTMTVQATSKAIDVYIATRTAAIDIDIYAIFLVRGTIMTEDVVRLSMHDARASMAILQAARGSLASLDARLDVSLNEDGTLKSGASAAYPPSQIAYGKPYLHSWLAQLAKIRYGDTAQAIIALIGDSWIEGGWRINDPLANWMHAEYGNAGPGYVSASEGDTDEPPNVTRTRAGTWTNRDQASTPAGRFADMKEAYTADAATPASVVWTATFTDAQIYYLLQSGGGSFRWKIDGGSWSTVSTDGATATGMEPINGLSDASHALTIEVTAAGTAGVVLFGVDLQRAVAGVRVHKLGSGGAYSSHAAALDETMFEEQITALAPHCVVLLFGTNDDNGDVVPATFRTNMETIASRVRAALPLCDILYLTQADNGLTAGTYTPGDYVAELRESAVDNDYACFDALLLLGDYTDANSRGLYSDTAHINAQGGHAITRTMIDQLLYLP